MKNGYELLQLDMQTTFLQAAGSVSPATRLATNSKPDVAASALPSNILDTTIHL
jgi:hypothetical protein